MPRSPSSGATSCASPVIARLRAAVLIYALGKTPMFILPSRGKEQHDTEEEPRSALVENDATVRNPRVSFPCRRRMDGTTILLVCSSRRESGQVSIPAPRLSSASQGTRKKPSTECRSTLPGAKSATDQDHYSSPSPRPAVVAPALKVSRLA